MLEELKSAEIIEKIGGRYRLCALIQKRMQELLQGSRPLIDDTEGRTLLEVVAQEILQEKITFENLNLSDRGMPLPTEASPNPLL